MEDIVRDKTLVAALRRCSAFMHTSQLESFHSTLLKYLPKRLAFNKDAFTARTYMAIMRFNENIGRPIQISASGRMETRLALPPSTRTWVSKAKLVEKTDNWRRSCLEYIFDERRQQSTVQGDRLHKRSFPSEPTQASFVPKPPRNELDEQFQKRRKLQGTQLQEGDNE